MEELRKLERLQMVLTTMDSHGLSCSSDSDQASSRFLANLVLLLVEPSGELDTGSKLSLVSDFIPKISSSFLEELSSSFHPENGAEVNNSSAGLQKNHVERGVTDQVDHHPLQRRHEDIAMIGLDAMKRANSTLEDFCRSYFMFHGLDVNKPQSIFKYLPILSFTESYIYQVDTMNEKIVNASTPGSHVVTRDLSHEWIANLATLFESDPFRPLSNVLESNSLLTERIQQEFRSGEEYWTLERKLCHALANKNKICLEDVMRAIRLKSFDYRVLNLLLYKLREEEVNDLHMEFLSISEFLVEVSDDLFDYEEDVLNNNFNVLRMFVRIFGPSDAPAKLAKCIAEAEQEYDRLLKTLDPCLSSGYQRRCEEATREGGKISGHPLGTWNIPAVISDEESFRGELLRR